MVDQDQRNKPHFILNDQAYPETFKGSGRGPAPPPPPQNRQAHGTLLLRQFDTIKPEMQRAKEMQEASGLDGGFGLRIEFEGFPEVELAIESLHREGQGIELLNVRKREMELLTEHRTVALTEATVFVPDGKLEVFEKLITAYLEKDTAKGAPQNRKLIDSIRDVRAASLHALWTDATEVFPKSDDEAFWWEVWLPVGENRQTTVERFQRLSEAQGFQQGQGQLEFPERTVMLVYGTAGQMKHSMMTLNSIAELRRAKETEFFIDLPPIEQPEWMEELRGRSRYAELDNTAPHVCLLDTGVNRGHPLIEPALAPEDMHTIEPSWGLDDTDGHGTEMAGLTLFGNLSDALESRGEVDIGHRLESVKLLSHSGGNSGDAKHFGHLTKEAVARPEATAPDRNRVFGMAVTARDNRDRGRPSAWSAAVDSLAADDFDDGRNPRLIAISGGNIDDLNAWMEYPASNATDGIHDPGQAWNALTVGAFTELCEITENDIQHCQPIASPGGLSPFSTTSQTWQPKWPLKPDVLFEGGNVMMDGMGASWPASLALLTCHHKPQEALFQLSHATSAATALATRMAARLMGAYPNLWPESIRALIVHSAQWTPDMINMFLPDIEKERKKKDYEELLHHCGFGVPDLGRAMWSASNSLTLIAQDSMRPFKREVGKEPAFREMHLHKLPWPLEELEALGETPVEMRVTLSYFIQPNPSERGFRKRYSYESHGFRFDVRRPTEGMGDFRVRINKAARDEEESTKTADKDPNWLIGIKNRHRGSLHGDIWRGTAVDLAQRGVLAVYPTAGWWKHLKKKECYDNPARSSLIVSIHAPEVEVDLYTAVASQIETPISIEY